ncbi:MAG TPA: DUF2079 domain-containing protein, partial [Methylomirabilota bacterium]|nr:DUF2079 domain-containing protein [Methylomirabilota bacterium]
MKRLARALDGVAVALAALALAVLVAGDLRVGGLALSRAEDVVVVLALVVGARLALAPVTLPRIAPRALLGAGIAAYLVLMGFVVVSRHAAFRTHALDLGYYVQVVWNLAHGHGARVTLPPMHAWGDHFSPVLYLLAPLGWLPSPAVGLVLAQTAILAAGAAAMYAFAARHAGDARLAAGFAGLYLLNPTLHGINIRDVHPAGFAIPLLVAAAAAFDARRPAWCAVALALALAGREDAAIVGVGFGIWLALARRRWALGAAVALGCVVLLWVETSLLMPAFRGEPYPHLVKRYAYLGDSLPAVLANVVLRPWRWLTVVATVDKAGYLLALLAPLGFLPLLAPRAAAGALPGLAVNLLSTDPVLFHHRTQYQAFVLPFLLLAAVEGSVALRRRERPVARRVPATAALALAAVLAVVLTSRTVNDLGVSKWRLGPEQRALHALLARVPPAVPVSVNERVVPHLATRR